MSLARSVRKSCHIYFLFAAAALLTAPTTQSLAQSPTDDPQAKTLLDQMATTMRDAKSLEAEMEIAFTRTDRLSGAKVQRAQGTMRLRKPNLALAAVKGDFYQLMASDGKSRWGMYQPTVYVKRDAAADGHNLSFHMAFLVDYFFTQKTDIYALKKQTGKEMSAHYVGKGDVEGTPVDIVELAGAMPSYTTTGQNEPVTFTFYIGQDHLPRRWMVSHKGERVSLLYDATYRNFYLDRDLTVESFAFSPPKDSKPFQADAPVEKLLPVGKKAPDFSLPTPDKGVLALSIVRSEAKAVLVNFWFYG